MSKTEMAAVVGDMDHRLILCASARLSGNVILAGRRWRGLSLAPFLDSRIRV